MLVLQRKKDQSILVPTSNGVVQVAYLGESRGVASIGIKAPNSIPVMRYEIAPPELMQPNRLTQVERLCNVLEVSNIEQAINKARNLMENQSE